MTQDNTLVSPNVSACLKPGARKTQPALGLSPAKLGGTHPAESPNLSGSFCIGSAPFPRPAKPGDTNIGRARLSQKAAPPFVIGNSFISSSFVPSPEGLVSCV